MRGKPDDALQESLQTRITPACAGKTEMANNARENRKDHPRACGENSSSFEASRRSEGSPPRMRGKPPSLCAMSLFYRITPAHAGKTAKAHRDLGRQQDHPRACGENVLCHLATSLCVGSPPRMRGKHSLSAQKARASRITPAHAGKTLSAPPEAPVKKDHPRACGENNRSTFCIGCSRGSPPRMRGKLFEAWRRAQHDRITPAHAGKTVLRSPCRYAGGDHPRACGENRPRPADVLSEEGSPPRMRGKPYARSLKSRMRRITPAHAGKTTTRFNCWVGF